MTCQKEFAALHSTFPNACACLSLRVWQIGSRAQLWCLWRRLVENVGQIGGGYSGNHRTDCQPRLITLPHKRDGIFVSVRRVEMTIARNSLSGYGWNVLEWRERRGKLQYVWIYQTQCISIDVTSKQMPILLPVWKMWCVKKNYIYLSIPYDINYSSQFIKLMHVFHFLAHTLQAVIVNNMKFNLVSVRFSTKSSDKYRDSVCLLKLKWNRIKTFSLSSWNFRSHFNSPSQISLLLVESECRSKCNTNSVGHRRFYRFCWFLVTRLSSCLYK
jgi:hypothetical protein